MSESSPLGRGFERRQRSEPGVFQRDRTVYHCKRSVMASRRDLRARLPWSLSSSSSERMKTPCVNGSASQTATRRTDGGKGRTDLVHSEQISVGKTAQVDALHSRLARFSSASRAKRGRRPRETRRILDAIGCTRRPNLDCVRGSIDDVLVLDATKVSMHTTGNCRE